MERLVRLCRSRRLAVRAETHDVRDDVVRSDRDTLRLHAQSDLHVGLRLFVGVVFGVLAQSLYSSARNNRSDTLERVYGR